jgi:hypothetical protein
MISESEWLTRKRRIDGRLKALGWKIAKFSERLTLDSLNKVAVEELPTANGWFEFFPCSGVRDGNIPPKEKNQQ